MFRSKKSSRSISLSKQINHRNQQNIYRKDSKQLISIMFFILTSGKHDRRESNRNSFWVRGSISTGLKTCSLQVPAHEEQAEGWRSSHFSSVPLVAPASGCQGAFRASSPSSCQLGVD
jgi:hypothetical protein